jgi:hypothetical protein
MPEHLPIRSQALGSAGVECPPTPPAALALSALRVEPCASTQPVGSQEERTHDGGLGGQDAGTPTGRARYAACSIGPASAGALLCKARVTGGAAGGTEPPATHRRGGAVRQATASARLQPTVSHRSANAQHPPLRCEGNGSRVSSVPPHSARGPSFASTEGVTLPERIRGRVDRRWLGRPLLRARWHRYRPVGPRSVERRAVPCQATPRLGLWVNPLPWP